MGLHRLFQTISMHGEITLVFQLGITASAFGFVYDLVNL
ncbi:hypothetical protein M132_4608 [Bacteroides fragilis str. S24L15]|uniref:Transmembrane protein n=1 Tax=Bacteroides fragilis str. 3783N1-6 TaxID=1339310 RepID=A0AB73AGC5_BACFG|nr:hypothetical protein M118_4211 [Bacteroides fragilis str. 3783N1-2]EXY48815.1 hypothetical protein M121_4442 [Bacteroides fragilis str. 3783N2-1]EXY53703.1 hypothetical protein M122_4308 [Bacteroides fragilis str. 3976T7]EXZ66572.1 hypothetical protein M120_4080 [Bacteroides fragilis str. 3783N1-8]EYA68802.1 hypothetical protein M132_4608 [Bacteroides fragilis str. S24L15]EYB08150.1 hypothetical protein M119_3887 [Bacteroides fragilis str. 3783N1-6]OCR30200.1 hypothetical protein AC141_400